MASRLPPALRVLRRHPLVAYPRIQTRRFTVLGIETSCDDTSVALLSIPDSGSSSSSSSSSSCPKLLYHRTITSPNRIYGGIHPYISLESHRRNLAPLISECLSLNPAHKPSLVAATRGPGMVSSLAVGLDTAKGLALAWGVPFVGVHHMQAHLLTPRLTGQLEGAERGDKDREGGKLEPDFPFLTLLVSGGHTMLLKSTSLTQHSMLAETIDIAIGDYIDKAARSILPDSVISAGEKDAIVYGKLLEDFAFPPQAKPQAGDVEYGYDYHPPGTPERKRQKKDMQEMGYDEWKLNPPLSKPASKENNRLFSFAGLGTMVDRAAKGVNSSPTPPSSSSLDNSVDVTPNIQPLRTLAMASQRVAFEHLASRITHSLAALPPSESSLIRTLVVSGGVASNRYLRHVLERWLEHHGYGRIKVVAPPGRFCTDNAAMIAWAGWEMWREGWRTEWGVEPIHRWGLEEVKDGEEAGRIAKGNREQVRGGILAAPGWARWRE